MFGADIHYIVVTWARVVCKSGKSSCNMGKSDIYTCSPRATGLKAEDRGDCSLHAPFIMNHASGS